MKKLLSILTLLICLNSAAQYPLTQYISSDSTLLVSRGGTKLRPVIWSYTDTTAANLQRIAQYPFSIIATTSDSSMYFRSLYNNMWIKMAGSSGGTSGAYWGITGNFMSVLPSGFGIGTNSPDNLPFKTDGTIRIILPSTGLNYQNDTTSNKPMVFNTLTKSWGYGSWFGGGGDSSNLTIGLEFKQWKHHNVYHGTFWPVNDSFSVFFWEAWVKPYDNCAYIISDGYSGEHCLLFGFSTGVGTTGISGNIYQDGVATSFTGADTIITNKIYHVAVGYDGSNIITYVNGVPSKATPYTGFRRTNNAGAGALYVGGSDHSNYNGIIYRIRGFEFANPLTTIDGTSSVFWPQQYFTSQYAGISFVADYSGAQNQIPDLSNGFLGTTHSGVRNYAIEAHPFYPNHSVNDGLTASDSLLPQYVRSVFEQPTITRTPYAVPAGAKVFDSYQRNDNTPAWNYWPTPDSTEGGTLGKKKYSLALENQSMCAGILGGKLWINNLGVRQGVVVDVSDTIQDVRITKATNSTISDLGIIAKYKDYDNNIIFRAAASGTVSLYKYIGGSPTQIGSFSMPASYDSLRVVVHTTTADVYVDNVLKISAADITGLPAGGTKCGIWAGSAFGRVQKFTVY